MCGLMHARVAERDEGISKDHESAPSALEIGFDISRPPAHSSYFKFARGRKRLRQTRSQTRFLAPGVGKEHP